MKVDKDTKFIKVCGEDYELGTPNIIALGFNMQCKYCICTNNTIFRKDDGVLCMKSYDGTLIKLYDEYLTDGNMLVDTAYNRAKMAHEIAERYR
jgi:hypothetical protein